MVLPEVALEFVRISDLDDIEMLGEGKTRSFAIVGVLTNLVRLSVDLEFTIFWTGSQLPREFAEAFFYPLLADAARREMAFNAMDAFVARHPESGGDWRGLRERLIESPVKRIYDALVLTVPGGRRGRQYAGLLPFAPDPQHDETVDAATDVPLDFASVRRACEDFLILRDDLAEFMGRLPTRHSFPAEGLSSVHSRSRSGVSHHAAA
jgi:hypothetical protein